MRISIWQQFSSNHSGYFWVVGTFKTGEEANKAYGELHHILETIIQWRRNHPEEVKQAFRSGNDRPLPPEEEIASQFKVDWPTTLDWIHSEAVDEAITVIGKIVIVTTHEQTWMTTQPFEGLLERLGASTVGFDLESVEGSEGGLKYDIIFRFSFTAPDEHAADELEKAIREYFSGISFSALNSPPWENDVENFKAAFEKGSILRKDQVDFLVQNWQERFNSTSQHAISSHIEETRVKRLAAKCNGEIVSNGLNFTLDGLWFVNDLGLTAFIAFLEAKGCTNIDFGYSRVEHKNEDKPDVS